MLIKPGSSQYTLHDSQELHRALSYLDNKVINLTLCLCYLLNCDMGQVTGLEICFDCLLKIKNITYIKLQSYKDNYTCMHAITQMEIIQKILNLYARGMNLMEFTLYTLQQQKKKQGSKF